MWKISGILLALAFPSTALLGGEFGLCYDVAVAGFP
jgi:hypothetical protein